MIVKLKELIRLLSELKIEYNTKEITEHNNKCYYVTFICNKMPDQNTKDKIVSYFPEEYKLEFKVTYKPYTIASIKDIIYTALNGDYTYCVIDRELKLYLDGTINMDNISWGDIKRVIDKDGFFNSWTIEINGKLFQPDLLNDEIAYNNSKRKTIVLLDEIKNLIILLNTTNSIDQFLKEI